jgi:hypothetical protein
MMLVTVEGRPLSCYIGVCGRGSINLQFLQWNFVAYKTWFPFVQELRFSLLDEPQYILVLDLLIHVSHDLQKLFLENNSWEGSFDGVGCYQYEVFISGLLQAN